MADILKQNVVASPPPSSPSAPLHVLPQPPSESVTGIKANNNKKKKIKNMEANSVIDQEDQSIEAAVASVVASDASRDNGGGETMEKPRSVAAVSSVDEATADSNINNKKKTKRKKSKKMKLGSKIEDLDVDVTDKTTTTTAAAAAACQNVRVSNMDEIGTYPPISPFLSITTYTHTLTLSSRAMSRLCNEYS